MTFAPMKESPHHLMEVVPFSLSSLESFDQPDQRDVCSSFDGYFSTTSQCDQGTILQGGKTIQELQPDGGVNGTPSIGSNYLSIFRPRLRSDNQYIEQSRNSNQSNKCSFEELASCPRNLQHKQYVQSSGKARQVSVGCESTFSSPIPSFNVVAESREDSVDSSEREHDQGTNIDGRVHHERKRDDTVSDMRNNYMRISSSLLSEKRKRHEVYDADNMAGNTWSPSTCNYRPLLATRAKLFTNFTFLLPDLKISVMNYVANKKSASNWLNENRTFDEVIARRRLLCAVQAYGGNAFRSREKAKRNDISSIFRLRNDDPATTTNNSERYEEKLQLQYFENGSHLSWDVEESKLQVRLQCEDDEQSTTETATINLVENNVSTEDQNSRPPEEGDDSTKNEETPTDSDDGPKLKYRCKLCGQPKQNHSCPFQQALQRNIGTMTFTALNAFQSHEPGELATPLSEMNNFVDLENDENDEYSNTTAKRTLEIIPSFRTPENEFVGKRRKTRVNTNGTDRKYKGDEKLFHKPMEIKPEQHRLVSVYSSNLIGDFKYPTLPLTFDQRKGASEELFQLCQEISGLTDDVAKVLQVARNTDLWDLAVAELITQILVAVKCGPGDESLDGLRKHLMFMGFSC